MDTPDQTEHDPTDDTSNRPTFTVIIAVEADGPKPDPVLAYFHDEFRTVPGHSATWVEGSLESGDPDGGECHEVRARFVVEATETTSAGQQVLSSLPPAWLAQHVGVCVNGEWSDISDARWTPATT